LYATPTQVARLVELHADDVARRAHGPRPLATALVLLATASAAPALADAAAAGARAAARTAGRPAGRRGRGWRPDRGQRRAAADRASHRKPRLTRASLRGRAGLAQLTTTLLNRETMSGSRK
jgi:hypothetical protein